MASEGFSALFHEKINNYTSIGNELLDSSDDRFCCMKIKMESLEAKIFLEFEGMTNIHNNEWILISQASII